MYAGTRTANIKWSQILTANPWVIVAFGRFGSSAD